MAVKLAISYFGFQDVLTKGYDTALCHFCVAKEDMLLGRCDFTLVEGLRFGDFNGDGKTCDFTLVEGLRFGDFNGDGKTDVFAVSCT
ncbi:MAG: hypothetical protein V7K73_13765 [Nostoc sp.]